MHRIEHLILLLPVAVSIFWVVVILFSSFKNIWRKSTLLFFMVSAIFSMLLDFLFYTGNYVFFKNIYILTVFFSLSQFPAFYNYIVSLTSEKSNSLFTYLKHWIIPTLLTLEVWYMQYMLLSGSERLFFVEEVLTGNVALEGVYKIVYYSDILVKLVFVLLAFFYFHLINSRVNGYEVNILDYFSNTDEISFSWFKTFKISFFFAFIFGVFYQSFDRDFHSKHVWISMIVFSSVAFFYWLVGFFGIKQIDMYKDRYVPERLPHCSEEYIDLDMNKATEIALSVDALIKNRKLFLEEDLTLVDLALITRTDRNSLSYVIKNHLGLNFNNYINQKRISYAKDILSLNRIVSSQKLFKDCGFKSQVKFCTVFKDITGETPIKFRNKVLLSDNIT